MFVNEWVKENEYSNISKMCDDMVNFVRNNGGEISTFLISPNDVIFCHWNARVAWSIKSKFIPKDSEFTKILFAGHLVVEKLLKIINRKSKDFKKKITEEEITKILQEECNVELI